MHILNTFKKTEMKRTLILSTFTSLFLVGCAGMMRKPLPIEQRTTVYAQPFTIDKAEAFKKVKFWLPLNVKSEGQLIKAEDANSGMIAGDAYIKCDELPGSSMVDQQLGFSFLVEVDKKSANLKFTDQRITTPGADGQLGKVNTFNDSSQIEGAKKCLDILRESFKKSLI
jgi:hypothetical protein